MKLSPQQIENIGYDSHNSIINLNTIALVVLLITIKVVIAYTLLFMY